MSPDENDLWFLPLGGTGEIGMNMNLYGHADRWLMVDCGVTFAKATPEEQALGLPASAPPVQIADPEFISARRDKLAGIIITHAHEDHVGGVHHIWERLQCPVYTTAFTARVLHRKLREKGIADQVPVHIIDPTQPLILEPFTLEWIPLTHSIPEPYALLIQTPVGNVFHTADWKLDPHPVIGEPVDQAVYQQLSERNISAMVCDSTCATRPGHSESEGATYAGLKEIIASAKGRVVIGCFASNLARLKTLYRIAEECDRHFSLLGRSMQNMVEIAREAGIWEEQSNIIDPAYLSYLPKQNVLAIATGSQGEPRTALYRLSHDTLRDLSLEPGDTVIFSSRCIPGNELPIQEIIDRLQDMQVTVVTADDSELSIHASGHPSIDELEQMYRWVKPQLAIPTHGESQHLRANAKLAHAVGVPFQTLGKNGDLFYIAPYPGIRRNAVNTGRLGLVKGQLQPFEPDS